MQPTGTLSMTALITRASKSSIPVTLLDEKSLKGWLKKQPARVSKWLNGQSFKAKPGSFMVVPDDAGKPARVVAGLSETPSLWDLADLPYKLPAGIYHLDWDGPLTFKEWLTLGWELGTYKYTRYKKSDVKPAQLVLPSRANAKKISRYAESVALARDLINTPAEDMGPAELAAAIVAVGKKYRAKVTQIVGNDLLKKNYPAIHIVGRASDRAPRLVDLTWGNPKHPKVTIVGKGVCFDTGGLDLKPPSAMYTMKKDMGGAACALAIARMVMDAKLPVRLRLMIPAVENSVSSNAFRPGDVITMRNGTTVEVGNTDAEGRLVLADAMSEAVKEKPVMLFDLATLTGAARSAVGMELAALFCNDDKLAENMLAHGVQMEDQLWRMPLHKSYKKMLDSPIADLNSAPNSPYAGAITAALFLQHFVPSSQAWAHLDLGAWNNSSKPGRPEGGEAMAVRAIFRVIEDRYGK